MIESLIKCKVDKLLIGGYDIYLLQSQGFTIGKSLVEDDMMPKALEIEQMENAGIELILPTDRQVVDTTTR